MTTLFSFFTVGVVLAIQSWQIRKLQTSLMKCFDIGTQEDKQNWLYFVRINSRLTALEESQRSGESRHMSHDIGSY